MHGRLSPILVQYTLQRLLVILINSLCMLSRAKISKWFFFFSTLNSHCEVRLNASTASHKLNFIFSTVSSCFSCFPCFAADWKRKTTDTIHSNTRPSEKKRGFLLCFVVFCMLRKSCSWSAAVEISVSVGRSVDGCRFIFEG